MNKEGSDGSDLRSSKTECGSRVQGLSLGTVVIDQERAVRPSPGARPAARENRSAAIHPRHLWLLQEGIPCFAVGQDF